MQNKLNEILELCIEKSSEENILFYSFSYCNRFNELKIEKQHRDKGVINVFYIECLDQALEYMQNE